MLTNRFFATRGAVIRYSSLKPFLFGIEIWEEGVLFVFQFQKNPSKITNRRKPMASSRAKQAIEDLIRLGAKKVERPMLEIKVTQQNFADVADCLKIHIA